MLRKERWETAFLFGKERDEVSEGREREDNRRTDSDSRSYSSTEGNSQVRSVQLSEREGLKDEKKARKMRTRPKRTRSSTVTHD